MAALMELRADAEAHGGRTLILGDILDQPHTVHMRSYLALRELLHGWPGPVYVIAGNHDQFGDGWLNGLQALEGGACKVVSEPTATSWGRMLPYTKPESFVDVLEALPVHAGALPIVWCHHGFRGAYRNAMSQDRDGVSCMDIPPRHVVVSGHYHMPQNLGRIVYTGSPYQTSFSEEGQIKGWLRWADPAADPFPVRVPFRNVGAPRHYSISWDPADGPPERPEGMLDTDRPRIVTQVTRDEAKKHAAQLKKAGLDGVPILAAPSQARERRGVVDPRLGPVAAVQRYVSTVLGTDGQRPEPHDMTDFASEVNLWAD
jgi:hypothetical protein